MAHSILKNFGFRTGLYISPHLITARERIRIGDELIGEEDVARLVQEMKKVVDAFPEGEKPTFFELYTMLAFLYFKEKRVDFAVYEVGMGGRLDATNIVRPLVSGITPVSYDHMKSLGARLGQIAAEKAGIIKDRVICVVSPQEGEAMGSIEASARSRHATLLRIGREIFFEEVPCGEAQEVCNIFGIFDEYPRCELSLLGEHQALNAATAVGIVEALRYSGFTVPQDAIREGLRRTEWPGRLEIVGRDPYIVLDGAHNRASAAALAKAVRQKFRFERLFLILGVSRDKDIQGIVKELEPIADRIILTRLQVASRAAEPSEIMRYIKRHKALSASNVQEALDIARRDVTPHDMILITGSLFLVGEAKAILDDAKSAAKSWSTSSSRKPISATREIYVKDEPR
jgi:dihydrofolate synthase/folylpolyglutamate synthase